MPNSIATRAQELQQRYKFLTAADGRLLAKLEAQEAEAAKKPSK